MNALPLKLSNLELNNEEADLLDAALNHTVLWIIVNYGGPGFAERWKENLEECRPSSDETIEVHQTPLHPLPAMEIDENSTQGNVEVIEAITSALELDPNSPDYTQYVKIIAGDQLTIARQRSIMNVRAGHEDGAEAWKHVVLMPGLFHAKIADCHGVLQTHFGVSSTRSPGSLAFHNTRLDRLPIVLTSLPPFRTCRDLIFISLYARIRHCLLLVSGYDTLQQYLANVTEWAEVQQHAREIRAQFMNADQVQELRESRVAEEVQRDYETKQAAKDTSKTSDKGGVGGEKVTVKQHISRGDMVFENACLFMRDALFSRLFSNAVKVGDSGLVVLVLKMWAFAYRGNGRTKYAHEMLHLLHNLVNVWSKELRHAITQNWLLNPTGKANAFVEIDLVQEHLNFWIKKIYKADGDAHSWDWLALVSPCVDVLRRLAARIHNELGTIQGSEHTIPDLEKDMQTLMDSLTEHEVYIVTEGRVLDPRDSPVPDVLSTGLGALAHGPSSSPIDDFNVIFNRQRDRLCLQPVSALTEALDNAPVMDSPVINREVPAFTDFAHRILGLDAADPVDPDNLDDEDTPNDEPLALGSNSEDEADDDNEDLFVESPTLTRFEEGDIALEMDDWDLEGEYSSGGSDVEDDE
ncbi:hypothetical protein B0H34DRAFT_706469 [Crassisporium funariophilum]|nr:hypothetical protein B0H34DRAFT_706452 [Crassisporium funariophilum]KAF8157866.1 hypothetical protein B0H34DRAFT_706469 [Crassisporium funariophilum]